MKNIFLFILLLLTLISSSFAGQNDITTSVFYSNSLCKLTTFYVYLPPDRKPGEKFPVLYILHGAWGCYKDWVNRTNVEDLADKYRMILVFPDGDQFGWYLDSPIKPDSKYESYIIKDLVPEIDKQFATIPSRKSRGIMGLSMGGHGAFILALKHPNIFGSASSMSGILKLTNHSGKWHIPDLLGPMDKNSNLWESNSVYEQAGKFRNAKIKLLFDCGLDDTNTGAIDDARLLHTKLVTLGVKHKFKELPGTHSWNYWQTQLESHLDFHWTVMTKSVK